MSKPTIMFAAAPAKLTRRSRKSPQTPLTPTEAADLAEGRRLMAEYYTASALWAPAEEQIRADGDEYGRLKVARGDEIASAFYDPRQVAFDAVIHRVCDVRCLMAAYVLRLHGVTLEPHTDENPTGFAVIIDKSILIMSLGFCTGEIELFVVPATSVLDLTRKESQ